MKMIVCGHGTFAKGMLDALSCIIGQHDIHGVTFDTSRDELVFEEQLRNEIAGLSNCEPVLIACDLVGGTPYKTAIKQSMAQPYIKVIGGINLALLIELAVKISYAQEIDIEGILEEAKRQMKMFTLTVMEDEDEED